MVKPSKEQIQQYLSGALERSLAAYAKLDEKEWGKKASSDWTAKDYLAHLVIAQEEETSQFIRQALAGERLHVDGYDSREAVNEVNARLLAKVKDASLSELMSRYEGAYRELLQSLAGLSEADLDKPVAHPGWGQPGTVRDLFFSAYLHIPGHYQDIRRVSKKKLPHWMDESAPEEVHFQLDRIFNFMPLIYWAERGGDMKATYMFNMEGDGGGKWALRIEDGKAETLPEPPDEFDVEVKTKPPLWIDLSNNDLNPVWAITTRKVHLGGNASLAMKLGSLFQVSE